MARSLILLGLCLGSSRAFLMTRVDPGILVAEPGHTVRLLCATDDHWEWCRFTRPDGTFCDFEWKRLQNNVTMQQCDFPTRIDFLGSYDQQECGITIRSLEPHDTGIWKCHIEEYIFAGSRGSGRSVEESISVSVRSSTTPPLATPTTTPTTTTTTRTKDYEDFKEIVDHEETKLVELAADSVVPDPVPQVVNRSQLEDDSSAVSTIIGIICAIIIIAIGALAFFYVKRRRRAPDRSAAVVFEQEARAVGDQKTIVPGARTISISGSADNPDLHEFFPPRIEGMQTGESSA